MQNPEIVCKQLFSNKKDLSYVKYKYKITSRLISIKVVWELSYLNILIKDEL